MKQKFIIAIVSIFFICLQLSAQTGIGTATPHASAQLDIESTNKGILIPRIALANRPSSPATGLLIYQTDNTPGFYYYNGSSWEMIGSLWNKNGTKLYTDKSVGINTNNPGYALDVRTTGSEVIANLQSANVSGYVMMGTDGGYVGYYGVYNGASDMDFGTGAGNTSGKVHLVSQASPVLTATSDFRVGIGNTFPAEKLDVNGAIKLGDAVSTPSNGTIRYTSANGFEGRYNGSWQSLINTTGWGFNGNSGTTASNFIGTTDAQKLRIRVNNDLSGIIEHAVNGSTSWGYKSLFSNAGSRNVAVGYEALSSNTSGSDNIASGYGALRNNTTAINNLAIGTDALAANSTSDNNVAIGNYALSVSTGGIQNTAVGYQSMIGNTTGDINTAIGMNALAGNTVGSYNTGVGYGALNTNTTGFYNTAIGFGADVNTNNLTNATAIGYNALVSTSNSMVLGSNAKVGIGTSSPTAKLHVVGSVRIEDGLQAANKVLTSDGDGNASWQTQGITLDGGYDFGSAGAGRTITADNGAVKIAGTDGLLVTGTLNSGADPEISGAGVRMFFNPKKAAFRAGGVSGTEWNNANIGLGSIAAGFSLTASGENAVALGYLNTSSANYSTTLGSQNTASNTNALAAGYNNDATGKYSVAIGYNNDATAEGAITIGSGTSAPSFREVTVGALNTYYTPASTTAWSANDRIFTVGNGSGTGPMAYSDAMVVLKNGNVGFGSSTPATKVEIKSTSGMTTPQLFLNEESTSYARLGFKNTTGNNWTVAAAGNATHSSSQFNIYYDGTGIDMLRIFGNGNAILAGTLTQNSDKRLKRNIQPLQNSLEKIALLNGYNYQWKKDLNRGDAMQTGFLAQEVEALFPELVITDDKGIKSVAYQNLTPVLVEAIKDLKKENEELKSRLDRIEQLLKK